MTASDAATDPAGAARSMLDRMRLLLKDARPLSWDGPDDRSGTTVIELDDDVELCFHDHADTFNLSVEILDTSSHVPSGQVATVVDHRIGSGFRLPTTMALSLEFARNLIDEWISLLECAELDPASNGTRKLVTSGARARWATIQPLAGAAAFAAGMGEAFGLGEFMLSIEFPTTRSPGSLCFSADGSTELRLDAATETALLDRAGTAAEILVLPSQITYQAHMPLPEWFDPEGAVTILRSLAELGLDKAPTIAHG